MGVRPNVLIVTEHIVRGDTMRRMGTALHEEGIDFDVASLWATKSAAELRAMFAPKNTATTFNTTEWYIGKENAGASSPFGSEVSHALYHLGTPLNEASGVKKSGPEPITQRDDQADRDLVKLAREKVQTLADELYAKHFNEHQNSQ